MGNCKKERKNIVFSSEVHHREYSLLRDNMLRFVNPAVARITGIIPWKTLQQNPSPNLIHPDDIGMIMDRYTRRLQGRAARDQLSLQDHQSGWNGEVG